MKLRKRIFVFALSVMMCVSLISIKEVKAEEPKATVIGETTTITERGSNAEVKYTFELPNPDDIIVCCAVYFRWDASLMTLDSVSLDNMLVGNVKTENGVSTLKSIVNDGTAGPKCGLTLKFKDVLAEPSVATEVPIALTFEDVLPDEGVEFSGYIDESYLLLEEIAMTPGKIVFAPKQTMTFDADGGTTTPATINEAAGTDIDLNALTAPTKTGYTFAGWYSGSTKYENTIKMPTGGLVLTAKWILNNYKLIFNANGGTGTMADETYNYEETKALTKNLFTRTGYTFKGWSMAAVGTAAYLDEVNYTFTATADTTVYAQWEKIAVTPETPAKPPVDLTKKPEVKSILPKTEVNSTIPKTGDISNTLGFVLLLSFAGIALVTIARKKSNKKC